MFGNGITTYRRLQEIPSPTTWHGEEMPCYLYDSAAAEIVKWVMDTIPREESVKASSAANRVFAYMWRFTVYGLGLVWLFYLVFPPITVWSGVCHLERSGLSAVPDGLPFLYLLVVLLAVWFEHKALSALITLENAFIGGYSLLGIKIPLKFYWPMIISMSVASRLDIAANGLIYGQVLHTSMCHSSEIEALWHTVLEQSMFSALPSDWLGLSVLTTVAYASMILQLVFAVYEGFPFYKTNNERVHGFRWWLESHPPQKESPYAVTLQSYPDEVWAPQLVGAISHAARMSALTFRQESLFNVSDEKQLRDIGGDPWVRQAASSLARRAALRALLLLCTEGTLFLNLKCSLLAMEKHITGKIDMKVVISALLSCFMATYNLCLAMKLVYAIVSTLWPELDDERLNEKDKDYQIKGVKDMKRSNLRGQVIGTVMISFCAILMYMWLTTYAALKTMMVFYCEDGTWNFAWPLTDGCV